MKLTAARGATLIGAAICAAVLLAPSSAAAKPYAPLHQHGPKLRIKQAKLRDSLHCTGGVGRGKREPVLLLSGTTVDPTENFSWNYERALSERKIPWCASFAPDDNMSDIQRRGKYTVYAIREMYRRAGRKIAIFGYSQGGMVPRWALRFWPDTRGKVEDLIAADPSNHGTLDADVICPPGCAPSLWQQRTDSPFIKALNSRKQTFGRVDYTVAYSQLDEVVVPNFNDTGRSSLHGPGHISNIAVQDICPGHVAEHLTMGSSDPVGWALFIDAYRHRGTAKGKRIDRSVCSKLLMPGVDPATFATKFAGFDADVAQTLASYPHTSAEPKLRRYVFAR